MTLLKLEAIVFGWDTVYRKKTKHLINFIREKYSNSLLVKASLTDCLQYQKIFNMAFNKLQISSTSIHGNYR